MAPTTEEDVVVAADARGAVLAGVEAAQNALIASRERFCGDAEVDVEALDRYGQAVDDAATVGDVQTAGAVFVDPRESWRLPHGRRGPRQRSSLPRRAPSAQYRPDATPALPQLERLPAHVPRTGAAHSAAHGVVPQPWSGEQSR